MIIGVLWYFGYFFIGFISMFLVGSFVGLIAEGDIELGLVISLFLFYFLGVLFAGKLIITTFASL